MENQLRRCAGSHRQLGAAVVYDEGAAPVSSTVQGGGGAEASVDSNADRPLHAAALVH
jgi:hypothetical protein